MMIHIILNDAYNMIYIYIYNDDTHYRSDIYIYDDDIYIYIEYIVILNYIVIQYKVYT